MQKEEDPEFIEEYDRFKELHEQFDRDLQIYAHLLDKQTLIQDLNDPDREMPVNYLEQEESTDSQDNINVEALMDSHRKILGGLI